MATSRRALVDSGSVWFALSAIGSVGGGLLLRQFGNHYLQLSQQLPPRVGLLAAGVAAILVAGFAAWRLARVGLYAWLLPVAALNLILLQPGRAGDVATWRLEWGVMGLAWTLVAVIVFLHLLRRSDELERRLHLEGASLGLAATLVSAVLYALFENRLPSLTAQWVAVAMLLAWWAGYLLSALKYRWRA